jgi:hypothetical protein
MHPDAPYFSILLCLMPDDFTCQVESAATQWVNKFWLVVDCWISCCYCNLQQRELLDGTQGIILIVTRIQKWNTGFSGGDTKLWILVSQLDTEKKI